ncbi:extensin family protein [Pseudorhodobacter ferrugineus]|uniref:extensin-like domain-containing protein n=1 Tax=Pseudorhodobacter ferrugineus TaxID=77008 RepID=UPI001FD3FEDE|nr:extensin family protein [Pseudorhodobacter ferrugineus]
MPRPEGVQAAVEAPKRGLLGKLFGPEKVIDKKLGAQEQKTYGSSAICQDSAIQGTAIPSIRGAQSGCGVDSPVRITAVDGVTLSTPATIDCDTARALRKWVTNKVKPAFGRNEVTQLHVAAHYVCRGRNNKKGARISEHGRGKAIDVSGFTLADGTKLSIQADYKSSRGKAIRKAHKGACGIFGTTLGPGSDGYHEDHLHFDTAKYRGGPYCK